MHAAPPHPVLRLRPNHGRRAASGHPWVFSNELALEADAKNLPPGGLVRLEDSRGRKLGVATFNPHSLIAARILDRDPRAVIDQAWLEGRLRAALDLRERLFPSGCYRLVHAEADGLPGLVIDRYRDVVTMQLNTAGMDRLTEPLLAALDAVIAPRAVVLRNDSPVRVHEGLPLEHSIAKGTLDGPVELVEGGARFMADLTGGQKTGWFYDQRDNRAFVARLARGRRCIDFYTYAGGFAVQMALGGASHVVAVDRSEASLALAADSARRNDVALETCRGDAFAEMARRADSGERYGVVVTDPPAFAKRRKDAGPALKGYRKMARLATQLVEPGGVLLCGSCSHHVDRDRFVGEIVHGVGLAGRTGRVVRIAGAGPDHPIHPMLPESAYLKAVVLQLD
jgi:23S rRNA (cytosine1962-C5)-methyltransferase